mmetsp:Transcript_11695/g.27400  ORF Transcript_11695/g.27400 Transcript_11695/m.27400 type:complete len:81 (-) Transcript_11695:1008-1250(-)
MFLLQFFDSVFRAKLHNEKPNENQTPDCLDSPCLLAILGLTTPSHRWPAQSSHLTKTARPAESTNDERRNEMDQNPTARL